MLFDEHLGNIGMLHVLGRVYYLPHLRSFLQLRKVVGQAPKKEQRSYQHKGRHHALGNQPAWSWVRVFRLVCCLKQDLQSLLFVLLL